MNKKQMAMCALGIAMGAAPIAQPMTAFAANNEATEVWTMGFARAEELPLETNFGNVNVFEGMIVKAGEKADLIGRVKEMFKLDDVSGLKVVRDVNTNEAYGDHMGVVDMNGTKVPVFVHVVKDSNEGSMAQKFYPAFKTVSVKPGEKVNIDDIIINRDKLPEGTKIEMNQEPNTEKEGERRGKLAVTYPDGSSEVLGFKVVISKDAQAPVTTMTIPLVVGGRTETKINEDAKKLEEDSKQKEAERVKKLLAEELERSKKQGVVPTAESATLKTTSVIMEIGGKLDPKDFISNKDDIPKDTRFEIKEGLEGYKVGRHNLTLVAKFADNSQKEYNVELVVVNKATDKSKLNDLLAKEVKRDINKIDGKHLKSYTDAYKKAVEVAGKDDATQEEIDKAYDDLLKEVDAIDKVEKPGTENSNKELTEEEKQRQEDLENKQKKLQKVQTDGLISANPGMLAGLGTAVSAIGYGLKKKFLDRD